MTRTKKKRIVWTLAVLLVLAFVAAVFLLRSPKPKVFGSLSKEDVSKISRIALRIHKDRLKSDIHSEFKRRDYKNLVKHIKQYISLRTLSIYGSSNRYVTVLLGARFTGEGMGCVVHKDTNVWALARIPEASYWDDR